MNRRNIAIGAALIPAALLAQTGEKPNIILITTDQQTAGAMSCAGNPYVRTPAMDALASDGILFTGAYSPFPLSGPCRASLLTGCYPSVVGATKNGVPLVKEYLADGIGIRMSGAGYECLFAGKYHAPEQKLPANNGFKKVCDPVGDLEVIPHVDKALDAYDGSKPLFLVVNFVNPHEICQVKHEEIGKMTGYIPEVDPCRYPPLPDNFKRTDQDPDVLNLEEEMGGQFAHYPMGRYSELDWQRYLYNYYRLVERADACIGDLVASLKAHGLYDNSVIVFCSDHGDGAAAHEWNGKWALMEESVNVPMIIKAPKDKGPAGVVNDSALVTIGPDLYSTFCDFAGISLNKHRYVGQSLAPVIYGQKEKTHDDIFIETLFNFVPCHGWSLIDGKFKYVLYQGCKNNEALFDLEHDKGEMHNLLDDPEYAGQLKTCRLKMQKWADRLRNWQCKVRIDPIVKYTYETPNDPVTILSTDLSVDLDPDDWFDAYLFMKSAWMRPQGIILTDYAGEKEFELARQLEQIAGHTEIPLLAGVNERFESGKTPRNTEGAEFILKTLREQRVKTRLIAVGSLRNEALAYEMDPELFKRKVEEVVFVSVPLNGEKATNVNRDTAAVRVIFESGVPILAVPNVKQKLSGEMESTIAATNSAVCDFLTKRLADWRGRRQKESPGFLKKTDQLQGQGKNLWSLPVFIPETLWAEYGIKAVRCSASYAPKTSTVFPEDKRGNDFLMTEWDTDALLDYTMKMICE